MTLSKEKVNMLVAALRLSHVDASISLIAWDHLRKRTFCKTYIFATINFLIVLKVLLLKPNEHIIREPNSQVANSYLSYVVGMHNHPNTLIY